MKHKGRLYIILSVALFSLAVTAVDAWLKPDYALKVGVKIVFFLLLPLLYFVFHKSEFPAFRKLFCFRRETMLRALGIGALIYAVIVGGYFLSRGLIDFSGVAGTLQENHGITAENFLLVSLYISLMNSFLEEFFFRGFGFITLKPFVSRTFAYLFSPTLFAAYHAGMLLGMFSFPVLLLLFVGLFIGGYIFNRLNETSESIYTSWVSHMCANFAINTVGFILLGMV